MALIYIVEDDKSISEIEEIALKSSGHTVHAFESARDFYKILEERIPDLVLLDVMLPGDDGYTVAKKLRQLPETKRIPIIMVTAKTTELDMIKGLDIGADDYIKKPFSVIELITRVKAILRRTAKISDEKILSVDEILLDNERHRVYVGEDQVELTYKEYELLKLLMTNRGIVLSRDVIMERVWGTDFEGETRTVDMHIKTLRQKLGEGSNHIKTVRNVGYLVE